jgi:hypothetical protein
LYHVFSSVLRPLLALRFAIASLTGACSWRLAEYPLACRHIDGPDGQACGIQNALLESAAGVPTVLHFKGTCPAEQRPIARPGPLGGNVEYPVAAYLLVASPGSTLSISSGWWDEDFCWRPEFDVEYGIPLGEAKRTGPHSWTRNYTRCNVAVDVSQRNGGTVELL